MNGISEDATESSDTADVGSDDQVSVQTGQLYHRPELEQTKPARPTQSDPDYSKQIILADSISRREAEDRLRRSNLPRRWWRLATWVEAEDEPANAALSGLEKLGRVSIMNMPIASLATAGNRIVKHWEDGDNLLIIGGDFSSRMRCLAWLAIRAMFGMTHYFRDPFTMQRPLDPAATPHALRVKYVDLQYLVDIIINPASALADDDDKNKFVRVPDVLILPEIGSHRDTVVYRDVLHEVLSYRYCEALMTIVSLAYDVRHDMNYSDNIRHILGTYKVIRL